MTKRTVPASKVVGNQAKEFELLSRLRLQGLAIDQAERLASLSLVTQSNVRAEHTRAYLVEADANLRASLIKECEVVREQLRQGLINQHDAEAMLADLAEQHNELWIIRHHEYFGIENYGASVAISPPAPPALPEFLLNVFLVSKRKSYIMGLYGGAVCSQLRGDGAQACRSALLG